MVDRPIDLLARRVQDDHSFLAPALAAYARAERLDERGLAARLGCGIVTLASLRLCRRPRPEPAAFDRDVRRIATRFGLDPTVLTDAVRPPNRLVAPHPTRAAS